MKSTLVCLLLLAFGTAQAEVIEFKATNVVKAFYAEKPALSIYFAHSDSRNCGVVLQRENLVTGYMFNTKYTKKRFGRKFSMHCNWDDKYYDEYELLTKDTYTTFEIQSLDHKTKTAVFIVSVRFIDAGVDKWKYLELNNARVTVTPDHFRDLFP